MYPSEMRLLLVTLRSGKSARAGLGLGDSVGADGLTSRHGKIIIYIRTKRTASGRRRCWERVDFVPGCVAAAAA